jgi:transcriptional regulator with XRE-family HTH domain
MRKERGLTGTELGAMVGMSQPTISRIERGTGQPDPADVGRIARALGADEQEASRLEQLADRSHSTVVYWRPNPVRLTGRQRSAWERESTARVLRSFEPALIAGPLQTSEYARAVLSAFQALMAPGVDLSATPALPQAVTARVRRQENLTDRRKTFHFVMAEGVLANQVCSPEEMVAQIRRLLEVAAQDNITVAFVPSATRWRVPPHHGFTLIDEDTVTVDLYSNGLTAEDSANGRFYRQVFDSLAAQSATEIEPILERYLEHYLDLARSRRRG